MCYIDSYVNKTADIEAVLANKNIEVKKDGNYMLLKYGIMADFSDPIVQQCRGIIYKRENHEYICVCRPFDKFFNYQETNAADIDWSTAHVQEKIDGSIVKLYYDGYWRWSTNGVVNAFKAELNEFFTFGELIKKADNYNDINLNSLDNGCTYMFELVSPYNQVVIQYNKIHLYHIGTRDNITGKEINVDIGIEKPKEYPLSSLDDCVRAVEEMNHGEMEQEGFVVVDKDYNRIKIKSPQYFLYHRMANNGAITPKRLVEVIKVGETEEVIKVFPLFRKDILRYSAAMAMYRYKAQIIIDNARATYEEFDFDRAAAAKVINTFEYPNVGYWAIDNEGNVDDYIEGMKENHYYKVIENEANKL